MAGSRQGLPSWISAAAATRVDVEGNVSSVSEKMFSSGSSSSSNSKDVEAKASSEDLNLGVGERALSAAGAAVLSAVIVNPLDVAKTRLQAQAAGVPYYGLCGTGCLGTDTMLPDLKCSVSHSRPDHGSRQMCTPECKRYNGTLDVFYKVIRQEGFARLWRGTTASLALAVPTVGIYLPCYDILRNYMEGHTARNSPALTPCVPLVTGSVARSLACVACYLMELARTRMQAFRETQTSAKPPGVWKTLIEVVNPIGSTNNLQKLQHYRILWTGLGAQLACDVPFSGIFWSTLEPIRRKILALVGDNPGAASVLGANFSTGFIAGTLVATATCPLDVAATCPLDVARTRRQIERIQPGH